MGSKRRAAADTKEHILAVARELFYQHGIRATGVDRVAAEANVAPPTLYRIFGSKDDLVAAYLEREDHRYREWFRAAAAGNGSRERILALFDALAEQVRPDSCRGCPFLIALGELPDHDALGHRRAVAMKHWVRAQLGALADEFAATAPMDDPQALADQLMLVMEGVYATTQAFGPTGPAARARSLVEALLPRQPA
ncbi:TetR/AcrR family transcriptional regulator [Nocardia sputorum]|uniref:TetR family transcriptional regulator n=1 Tax=Nocardia sputorum TaxID=2984338 RepID=A0ABN6U6P9_9NOCA|nr:TetR/AcrR family transcriptional regulator [Nocardia sputorum]BDT92200.1 TetR family transcriptional regulator [Nocardia sputorum]BDU00803.1 TetR family transcriptional regulator [Nocardia sputorum]